MTAGENEANTATDLNPSNADLSRIVIALLTADTPEIRQRYLTGEIVDRGPYAEKEIVDAELIMFVARVLTHAMKLVDVARENPATRAALDRYLQKVASRGGWS